VSVEYQPWVHPRRDRLRPFLGYLRLNWITAVWWWFILSFFMSEIWSHAVSSFWPRLLLAISTAAAMTLVIQFAVSRGWIGEGESD